MAPIACLVSSRPILEKICYQYKEQPKIIGSRSTSGFNYAAISPFGELGVIPSLVEPGPEISSGKIAARQELALLISHPKLGGAGSTWGSRAQPQTIDEAPNCAASSAEQVSPIEVGSSMYLSGFCWWRKAQRYHAKSSQVDDLYALQPPSISGYLAPTCSNTSGRGVTGKMPVEAARIGGDFHPFGCAEHLDGAPHGGCARCSLCSARA